MLSAIEIAKEIIARSQPDLGQVISNLKLQKFLYYAQGFSLAIEKKPLFLEGLEAWELGPVVPDVYHHFKKYGQSAILIDYESQKTCPILDAIKETYMQIDAIKLFQMTHEESPWLNSYQEGQNVPITHESLLNFFQSEFAMKDEFVEVYIELKEKPVSVVLPNYKPDSERMKKIESYFGI